MSYKRKLLVSFSILIIFIIIAVIFFKVGFYKEKILNLSLTKLKNNESISDEELNAIIKSNVNDATKKKAISKYCLQSNVSDEGEKALLEAEKLGLITRSARYDCIYGNSTLWAVLKSNFFYYLDIPLEWLGDKEGWILGYKNEKGEFIWGDIKGFWIENLIIALSLAFWLFVFYPFGREILFRKTITQKVKKGSELVDESGGPMETEQIIEKNVEIKATISRRYKKLWFYWHFIALEHIFKDWKYFWFPVGGLFFVRAIPVLNSIIDIVMMKSFGLQPIFGTMILAAIIMFGPKILPEISKNKAEREREKKAVEEAVMKEMIKARMG